MLQGTGTKEEMDLAMRAVLANEGLIVADIDLDRQAPGNEVFISDAVAPRSSGSAVWHHRPAPPGAQQPGGLGRSRRPFLLCLPRHRELS